MTTLGTAAPLNGARPSSTPPADCVPDDVRRLAIAPRRHGQRTTRLRTVPELVVAIGSREAIDPPRAEAITETVLAHLRRLVPEEVVDVAAVLPEDLREFWFTAVPG